MKVRVLLAAWILAAVAPVALFPVAASAQDDEFVPEAESQQPLDESLEAGVDFGAVDDLLAADEERFSDPESYSYDPGSRRDPFVSLLRRKDGERVVEVERPEGVPGLLIDEIELEGIFELQGGPVAQVRSSSADTSYLLRPGDELWDGNVITVELDGITFEQSITDPTALKPFREVIKKLDPGAR